MFALYLCTSVAPKLTALTAKYYLLFQCNIFQRSMHHALLFCAYKHKHLGLKLAFQWGWVFFLVFFIGFFFCAICCRQRTVSWSSEKSEQQLQWGRARWSKLISELHITDLCQKHTEQQKWVFRVLFVVFSVFFMDAECRSLGPDDLLSKRVTRVSWEVDQLRRRRARLIIHILPQGKKLFIAVVRHSTGFYMIIL